MSCIRLTSLPRRLGQSTTTDGHKAKWTSAIWVLNSFVVQNNSSSAHDSYFGLTSQLEVEESVFAKFWKELGYNFKLLPGYIQLLPHVDQIFTMKCFLITPVSCLTEWGNTWHLTDLHLLTGRSLNVLSICSSGGNVFRATHTYTKSLIKQGLSVTIFVLGLQFVFVFFVFLLFLSWVFLFFFGRHM